jgi:MoaA/NifB/PqqE/SkfB family radical SAM enzyme
MTRGRNSPLKRNNAQPIHAERPPGKQGIGPRVRSALWLWARSGPSGIFFLLRAGLRFRFANRRRRRQEKRLGAHIPTVLALSPTLRCNYNCLGCYSRSRAEADEMTPAELNTLLGQAEDFGFLAVLITGGEPFLRDDLMDLIDRHRRLLFVVITNGSRVTPEAARRIAGSGNALVLVSVEGFAEDTDSRRGPGAHRAAIRAMDSLHRAGVPIGFSVTNHAFNSERLGSDEFVDSMLSRGCVAGLYSEYVPCGPEPRPDWLLTEEQRELFHRRVLALRAAKPIVLVQFPQDEYGELNRCTAAGQASLHINPQGGVEPCPFVPVSVENVRQDGLIAAIRSPFFKAIREQPHLLHRRRYACSLFEHIGEIKALADSSAKRGFEG